MRDSFSERNALTRWALFIQVQQGYRLLRHRGAEGRPRGDLLPNCIARSHVRLASPAPWLVPKGCFPAKPVYTVQGRAFPHSLLCMREV